MGKILTDDEQEFDFDVFISHSSVDKEIAMELVEVLEGTGVRCWIAPRDIRPSEEYGAEIIRGLRNSKSIVLLFSEASKNSRHVRAEIERATNSRQPIYCVRLEDIEFGDDYEFFLSMVQAIDSFGPQRFADWHQMAKTINWAPAPKRTRADAEKSAVRTAVQQAASSLQRWPVRLLRVIVYAAVGWGVLTADPLGLESASERASERVFFNLAAPFYGEPAVPIIMAPETGPEMLAAPRPAPINKWNDDITVLLLDDKALEVVQEPWPVSLDVHTGVLRDLYETYAPNAIMIDIFFSDRRPGQEEALVRFADQLKQIESEGNTKVYLAAFNASKKDAGILEELRDAATLVSIAWHPPNDTDTSPMYYPMARFSGDRLLIRDGADLGDAGPAFAIYWDLCDGATDAGRRAMNCPSADKFATFFEQPMMIYWGVHGPRLNWEQSNRGERFNCRAVSRSVVDRLIAYIGAGLTGESKEFPQDCPYSQLIRVADFADSEFRAKSDVTQAYEAALGGGSPDSPKIVFYGADLRGVDDLITTYTHGNVAGVYAHAMALDNLMTMGSDYIRYAETENVQRVFDLAFCIFVALFSVMVSDIRFRLLTTASNKNARLTAFMRSSVGGALILILNVIMVLPVVFIGAGIGFFALNLAPANWIGYLGIAGMVRIAESRSVEKVALSVLAWTPKS